LTFHVRNARRCRSPPPASSCEWWGGGRSGGRSSVATHQEEKFDPRVPRARKLRRDMTDAERKLWWHLRRLPIETHTSGGKRLSAHTSLISPAMNGALSSRSMERNTISLKMLSEMQSDLYISEDRVIASCASGTMMC